MQSRRLRNGWSTRLLSHGLGTTRATLFCVAAVAALAGSLGALHPRVTNAAQGLTLVVPVVAAAVLAGRRAAYIVAAAATVAFSLLIPPVGSVRVRLAQDLVALAVFSLVGVVVGTVVARRIEILGEVERQRSALLRSVSHDLRTPLSTIRAAASDLASDVVHSVEKERRVLRVIEDEAERLDRLVSNLLSLSRIEAGAYVPVWQAIDVAELVDATTARLERLFTTVTLLREVAPGLPVLRGDYTQLDQLLTNLLENAARHAPIHGWVKVSAIAVNGAVQLAVSDSGPGVDPADMTRIFEPFRSGQIAGETGIGLAICKAVAEGHGGTIAVHAASGGGAEFTVTLPHR